MFTEKQLKEAHSRVKTGTDFPGYVQKIKELGLITYEFRVKDGSTIYYGDNNHKVVSAPKYEPMLITAISSEQALKHTISIHQQGKTDFIAFCKQAAEAGVEKWVIDTKRMLCIYYDLQGNEMVAEPIPQGNYA